MDEGSNQRSRRQKSDKGGRFAALKRLKDLKGSKNKCDISTIDNVYEEVDEKQYSREVLDRQDDWIVDDDGCGYVEDGRDIFDDDLDDESINNASRRGRDKGRKDHMKRPAANESKSIRNMLVNMPVKKMKVAPVSLEEDELLASVMSELRGNAPTRPSSSASREERELSPSAYLRSLSAATKARSDLKSLGRTDLNQTSSSGLGSSQNSGSDRNGSQNSVSGRNESQSSISARNGSQSSISDRNGFQNSVSGRNGSQNSVSDSNGSQNCISNQRALRNVSDRNNSQNSLSGRSESENVDSGIDELRIYDASLDPVPWKQKEPDEPMDISTEVCDSGMLSPTVSIKKEKMAASLDDSDLGCTLLDEDLIQMLKDEPFSTEYKAKAESASQVLNIKEEPMDTSFSHRNLKMNVKGRLTDIPLCKTEDEKKIMKMYWWDAYEDMLKIPGTVYLFGKVWCDTRKYYASCCIAVKNIDRSIYLLPKEEASLADVYSEFNESVAPMFNIKEFRCKELERHYAFNIPGVPTTSQYLQVKYSASCSALPKDLKGKSFSHVFGVATTSLEQLLLSRKMKGPCWLEVSDPVFVANPTSFCRLEVLCMKPEQLSVSLAVQPPPPLSVLGLSLRTTLNTRTKANEVVMMGLLVAPKYHVDQSVTKPRTRVLCLYTRPSDMGWPVKLMEPAAPILDPVTFRQVHSEKELLESFLELLASVDPDLVVGHDLHRFGTQMLLSRILACSISGWYRLGKLKRALPSYKGKAFNLLYFKTPMSGRLVCDIKSSAMELIRSRSYDLSTLSQNVLHLKEGVVVERTHEEVKMMYKHLGSLNTLLKATLTEVEITFRIMLDVNAIPLALQITNIAGNVMSRTLTSGRSERNEFLLLHAFTEKNFIVPDKQYGKGASAEGVGRRTDATGARRKAAYEGGLVLDPKVGFYDTHVLLMDFNSLYPSIIQEYNICFTTVPLAAQENSEVQDMKLPDSSLEAGVLPTEIRKLVESRRQVKAMMKNPNLNKELMAQYNIRQTALKLTANSMYGCLGFPHSRFYAKTLAALVTAKGREILQCTRDLVQKLDLDVIYGDTDSIMINTRVKDYDQVMKMGSKVKVEVNKLYRKVELEIDGVFQFMLLLKKKKYAALTLTKDKTGNVVTKQEVKGIEIVRRDCPQISAAAGEYVLGQILCDQSHDDRISSIHNHLEQLKCDLHEGKVPIQLLTITKQLTKRIEDYANAKGLPHLEVARRLNATGGKALGQGDTVSYVVCKDEKEGRCYCHVSEMRTNSDSIKVDTDYYLTQQIHAVVARLCEPLLGIDSVTIAEHLGINSAKFQHSQPDEYQCDVDFVMRSQLDREVRFKDCIPLKSVCMIEKCRTDFVMEKPYFTVDNVDMLVLANCINKSCSFSPYKYECFIKNSLAMAIRSYIHKYYQRWMVCENPLCGQRTRSINMTALDCYPSCFKCQNTLYSEYSASNLYEQLIYFKEMFDLETVSKELVRDIPLPLENAYLKLKDFMEEVIAVNSYSTIDLQEIFTY